jgi:4-amino-4-deoxy-L-arabinose transferase-like glycosyltransferase
MVTMDSEAPADSTPRRRARLILFALLAVALVWRLVYFVEMQASPYADSLSLDSLVYHELAVEATHGRWAPGPTFYQPPLYPWSLGIVYSTFGASQVAAKMLQILLSVASCWLIYRIAEQAFDRKVAQFAIGFAAIYGTYIFFANELLAVTLVVFLDLLGLDLLLRAVDDDRKMLWGAAGALFGLSAVARPTILPFVMAVCLWIIVSGWRAGKRQTALTVVVVFAAGAALPILPLTLHNWLADGDLVLVASNGGFNFFIGNNPQSDGITAAAPGMRPDLGGAHADHVGAAREALGRSDATPKEISDYWYGRAWSHIRSDPGWATRHTAFKAVAFFNAYEVSNNRIIDFVTRHSSIYSRATVGLWIVLPLAVTGVIVGGGRRRRMVLLLLFVAVYSATVVSFFVNARFRMPVIGVLIVFAAAALVALMTRVRERRFDTRSMVAVAAAVLTAVVIRPLPSLRTTDAQAFFNEAEAYRSQEDFANAADWYRRALDEYPAYCDAAYNLARIYTDVTPDPVRVVESLEPTIDVCGEDMGIRLMLGRALCAVGRCDEGREHIRVFEEWDSVNEFD